MDRAVPVERARVARSFVALSCLLSCLACTNAGPRVPAPSATSADASELVIDVPSVPVQLSLVQNGGPISVYVVDSRGSSGCRLTLQELSADGGRGWETTLELQLDGGLPAPIWLPPGAYRALASSLVRWENGQDPSESARCSLPNQPTDVRVAVPSDGGVIEVPIAASYVNGSVTMDDVGTGSSPCGAMLEFFPEDGGISTVSSLDCSSGSPSFTGVFLPGTYRSEIRNWTLSGESYRLVGEPLSVSGAPSQGPSVHFARAVVRGTLLKNGVAIPSGRCTGEVIAELSATAVDGGGVGAYEFSCDGGYDFEMTVPPGPLAVSVEGLEYSASILPQVRATIAAWNAPGGTLIDLGTVNVQTAKLSGRLMRNGSPYVPECGRPSYELPQLFIDGEQDGFWTRVSCSDAGFAPIELVTGSYTLFASDRSRDGGADLVSAKTPVALSADTTHDIDLVAQPAPTRETNLQVSGRVRLNGSTPRLESACAKRTSAFRIAFISEERRWDRRVAEVPCDDPEFRYTVSLKPGRWRAELSANAAVADWPEIGSWTSAPIEVNAVVGALDLDVPIRRVRGQVLANGMAPWATGMYPVIAVTFSGDNGRVSLPVTCCEGSRFEGAIFPGNYAVEVTSRSTNLPDGDSRILGQFEIRP